MDLSQKPKVWLVDDCGLKIKTYFPKKNGNPTHHLIDSILVNGPAYEYSLVGLYVPPADLIEEVYEKQYKGTPFDHGLEYMINKVTRT